MPKRRGRASSLVRRRFFNLPLHSGSVLTVLKLDGGTTGSGPRSLRDSTVREPCRAPSMARRQARDAAMRQESSHGERDDFRAEHASFRRHPPKRYARCTQGMP